MCLAISLAVSAQINLDTAIASIQHEAMTTAATFTTRKRNQKRGQGAGLASDLLLPNTLLPKVARRIEGAGASKNKDRQEFIEQKQRYLVFALTSQGAVDAVERILKYGSTEKGLPLTGSPYFRDQLRLTADMRLQRVLTTGASQVSKTLANVNVLADCLVWGQIDCGYFFDSRDNLYNNQPQQIQPVLDRYIEAIGGAAVERSAVARFQYGLASGYFFYVTGENKESAGGAAESSKVASVSISAAWCEEYSSWGNVDITPRLGASALLAKPVRMLGTPGGGNSPIDKDLVTADHVFAPSVICPHCQQVTYLDVLGALLKPRKDSRTGIDKYFNSRGEILDFWGTADSPFVACQHCHGEISGDDVAGARLREKGTNCTADQFLDELPERQVYGGLVAISLSPLLRMPSDPLRVQTLIREGLEPVNPLIYCQNKLGIPSQVGVFGVAISDVTAAMSGSGWQLNDRVIVAGLDQGRAEHWLTVIEFDPAHPNQFNVLMADSVGQDNILMLLNYHNIDLLLMDNEPDRLAARDLSLASGAMPRLHPVTRLLQSLYGDPRQSGYRVLLADQKSFETDIKANKVMHGSIEMPCLDINTALFTDKLVASYTDRHVRVAGRTHRKFQRHITSIKRDLDSGKWLRPRDHDDDLFFSGLFAIAARDFWLKAATAKTSIAWAKG